jgi:hypothetical protein
MECTLLEPRGLLSPKAHPCANGYIILKMLSTERKVLLMKTDAITTAVVLMCCLVVCALEPQACAADKAQGAATLTEVKQETAQAFKAIEQYSAAQKDEAVKKMQAALADIDARIDHMENRCAANWRSMNEVTRKKEQAALRELKRERIKVAEWYGSMKSSSAETWEDTKKAFLKSTDSLSDAFNKAEKQLLPKQKTK